MERSCWGGWKQNPGTRCSRPREAFFTISQTVFDCRIYGFWLTSCAFNNNSSQDVLEHAFAGYCITVQSAGRCVCKVYEMWNIKVEVFCDSCLYHVQCVIRNENHTYNKIWRGAVGLWFSTALGPVFFCFVAFLACDSCEIYVPAVWSFCSKPLRNLIILLFVVQWLIVKSSRKKNRPKLAN